MGAQRESVRFGPTFHGPRLKWYTPWGVGLLVVWGLARFFVTGRPLWGKSDNATFFRDATVDYRCGPVEKLSRARWRRVAWRWALLGVPLLLLALAGISAVAGMLTQAWWAHIPWGTVLGAYAIVSTCGGIAYVGHLVAVWWPQRAYRKAYIYPAARVLARVTGTRYHRRDALISIALPPGFGEDAVEEPVRVYVPDVALDEKTKKRIADAVGARLGLPTPRAQWTESGVERAFVDLLPQPLPPASITLADLMDELLASPLDEPVVGVAPGGRVVRMDFRNDSPHTLGSAGSGAGKSTLYKFVAMQRLRHANTYAIILDFKKWSHLRWAGRLPAGRVLIEDEVPRIHEVLCRVLDELLWRKSFDLAQEAELESLPTVDVYVEEINTLMSLLTEWWKAEASRRKQEARTAVRLAKEAEDEFALGEAEEMLAEAMGLPTVSPAVQALRYGVNLGREFHIHFHFIGQSMSAKAAGGRDTRESFRTRLLARWDRKTWKMLADGVDFIACPSASVGVWAHVHGSEVDIVRVPYVADEDAVAYVAGGTRPSLPMFHGDARPAVDAEVRPVALPLSDLVAALPAKANGQRVTLDALRKAAQREGFPRAIEGTGGAGRTALYPVGEVLAWHRDRERLAVEA